MHTNGEEPSQSDINLALTICYTFKGILLQAVDEAQQSAKGYFHSPVPAVLMSSTVHLIAQLEEMREEEADAAPDA